MRRPWPMNGTPMAATPLVPTLGGSTVGQAMLGRQWPHPAMPAAAAIALIGSKPMVGVIGSWLRGSPARGPRAIPTPPSGFKYFPDFNCEAYVSAFFQAAANRSDFCCSLSSIGVRLVGTPGAASAGLESGTATGATATLGDAWKARLQGKPAASIPARGAEPSQTCTTADACCTFASVDEEDLGGGEEEDELAVAEVTVVAASTASSSCGWPAKIFASRAATEDCMFLRRSSASGWLPVPACRLPLLLHAVCDATNASSGAASFSMLCTFWLFAAG